MTLRRIFAFAIVSVIIIAPPALSFAQGGLKTIVPAECDNEPGGCQSICHVATLAQNILNNAIYFAVFVSSVLIAWAGWQYLTAGGQEYKVKAAKKMFGNIIIGLVLITASWLLVNTLLNALTDSSGLQWNRIC